MINRNIKRVGALALTLIFVSCSSTVRVDKEPVDYVNPFIGTGGHGHTHPGALVPNGMIQPSADTRIMGWDACSGYYYDDSSINGFSQTHLSGTGIGDYGDVLLMPTVGKQDVSFVKPSESSQQLAYASSFSHENETATPGYYQVFLDRYGVNVELTATERAAIHRYTYPESTEAGIILDLDYSLQDQHNRFLDLTIHNDSVISGTKVTAGWAWEHHIHFYAVFSKPFSHTEVNDTLEVEGAKPRPQRKVLLQFETVNQEEVLVKLAISSVGVEGAKNNLTSEVKGWEFDEIRDSARQKWNNYLSKIEVESGEEEYKTIFYTSLYHTGISPNLFTDADGRYLGMDKEVHTASNDHPMYTIFSLWDTFRAFHPLLTIIDPDRNTDYIKTLLQQYKDGGILPMWELAGNYTGTMIGYHAVSVIVDAYTKGYRDFDIETAYEASLFSAGFDRSKTIHTTNFLKENALVPISKQYKNTLGYVPCDLELESVAKGLEYAYNDWCIAQFAKDLGDTENYDKFTALGQNYKNYFDEETGFMRGRDKAGNWRTPFSPYYSDHREDDFCEGTAWQWLWFVPHDIGGLVDLLGGKEEFITKIDSLFNDNTVITGENVSSDISGLIGQYAHGNEPSHHVIHMYNYVDQPWKTQALVDSVMHSQYFNAPDGLSGNEDCGQMSAWYVLNAMGIYQVCPGEPTYSIGRPLFDSVVINLPKERQLQIKSYNNSVQNKYIASVKLNGKLLKTPFITHAEIVSGGLLEFQMTDKPTDWGVNK